MKKWKAKVVAWAGLFLFVGIVYYELWGKHLYIVTAYCDCPICINVPEFRDGRFASGAKVYWGGAAADRKVPFGTSIELVPFSPLDYWNIEHTLRKRKKFQAEDRGGKIKGRHIDLFIPQSMGGHKTALAWGKQLMRIRLNGELAD